LGELGKGAAEADAGQFRLDLASATPNIIGHVELGIEGLDLRRTTVQKQEDNRLVLQNGFASSLSASCQ
jgi:hypothetical protein